MNQVLPEWTNDHNGPYILGCEMAIVSSKVRFLLDNWTFLRIISGLSLLFGFILSMAMAKDIRLTDWAIVFSLIHTIFIPAYKLGTFIVDH